MAVRIIGIGRKTGGDDGAGPAVIAQLRTQGASVDFELHEIGEPSALIPLLEDAERVVIVDAALGAGKPGTIRVVRPEEVDTCPISSVSTHGMSVGQAIAFARVLTPEKVCPRIYVVAIAAEKPVGVVLGLSANVAAAIDQAANTARALAIRNAED